MTPSEAQTRVFTDIKGQEITIVDFYPYDVIYRNQQGKIKLMRGAWWRPEWNYMGKNPESGTVLRRKDPRLYFRSEDIPKDLVDHSPHTYGNVLLRVFTHAQFDKLIEQLAYVEVD